MGTENIKVESQLAGETLILFWLSYLIKVDPKESKLHTIKINEVISLLFGKSQRLRLCLRNMSPSSANKLIN